MEENNKSLVGRPLQLPKYNDSCESTESEMVGTFRSIGWNKNEALTRKQAKKMWIVKCKKI